MNFYEAIAKRIIKYLQQLFEIITMRTRSGYYYQRDMDKEYIKDSDDDDDELRIMDKV